MCPDLEMCLKNINYRPQAAENVLENDELRKKGLWSSVDLVEIQICRVITCKCSKNFFKKVLFLRL